MLRLGIRHSVPTHIRAAMEGSLLPEVRATAARESVLTPVSCEKAQCMTHLVAHSSASTPLSDGDGAPPVTCRFGADIFPDERPGGGSGGEGAPAA